MTSGLLASMRSQPSVAEKKRCTLRPMSGGQEIQPGTESRTAVRTPAAPCWASFSTYAHRRRVSRSSSRVGTFQSVGRPEASAESFVPLPTPRATFRTVAHPTAAAPAWMLAVVLAPSTRGFPPVAITAKVSRDGRWTEARRRVVAG
jgi:hypothetical protein